MKGPILGALVVGTTLLASCERKAPGPAECQVFAEIVMTVTEEAARTPPELQQAQLNEHVRSCLTTPYERRTHRVRRGDAALPALSA